MLRYNKRVIALWLFAITIIVPNSIYAQSDTLLSILKDELNREFDSLGKEDDPPYYMAFRVDDIRQTDISYSFGNLMLHNETRNRVFTPQLRIGDYRFDNTHEFEQDLSVNGGGYSPGYSELPLENNKLAIQHSIWLALDNVYKNVLREFHQKENKKLNGKKDTLLDFSKEKASVYIEKPFTIKELAINEDEIKEKLEELSNLLSEDSAVFTSSVSIRYQFKRKYFISTEGSTIVQNSVLSQLQFVAAVKNKEGNVIPQQISIVGRNPIDLLLATRVEEKLTGLKQLLGKLKSAGAAEPYAGPAILSAEAAGVFFHEIFGHRIEGHRLEKSTDGQTFTDKIGDKVLPKQFSIISDPTIASFQGVELLGAYQYDDEGVKSQKVDLVEGGALRQFLMCRKPISEISNSNGHGRAQAGAQPVSRQSNLIITASKTYTDKELRKRLLTECKKQKKDYGYYFKSVIGGFTVTDRFNPNVFNIFPSEVYRVYVDGRPDELVTGVELIGTPLTMFSNILYAGDESGFFSGFCGAESGYVPVSAVSPSIFVKKIETQKGMELKMEFPLLPSPSKTN